VGTAGEEELTIDELSARVGMSVRNIRAHQARGLLAPPRMRGRSGYYGAGHERRLRQIQAMQDEGLNLAAIAKVFRDGQLSELTAGLFADDAPDALDAHQLEVRLGIGPDDPIAHRVVELGLIELDGDRIRLAVPGLLPLAEEVLRLGVPLDAQLDALIEVLDASSQVARTYLRLAEDHLVHRLAVDTGGDPEAMAEALTRLRDLARMALDASFSRAMTELLRGYVDGAARASTVTPETSATAR
jgi:DNA-binding transcriptional MerR regulator